LKNKIARDPGIPENGEGNGRGLNLVPMDSSVLTFLFRTEEDDVDDEEDEEEEEEDLHTHMLTYLSKDDGDAGGGGGDGVQKPCC
jgi:hypothetical protein